MKKNPFQYGKPVQNPEDFFGRKEDIIIMYRQILSSNSLSIVGERKIGKTSLFLHLIQQDVLKKYGILPEDILLFYIDISSCTFKKSSDVFRRFLECISEKIPDKMKNEIKILLKKEFIPFGDFERIIAKISKEKKIVLFLDEFERISMIKTDEIFLNLRYLAQIYDITFVISTLCDLLTLFQEKRFSTSPFFNIFTEYHLRGLDENASRELIMTTFERADIKVDLSTVDSIIRFSGTNPFFLKLASYFYFEALMKGDDNFDNTLRDLIQQELEPHHRYNWDHLPRNEQIVLLDILKGKDTGDFFAERNLERKGYIVRGEERSCISSESFQIFLKSILESHLRTSTVLETQIAEIDAQHGLTVNDKNALKEAVSKIEGQQFDPYNLRSSIFEIIGYFEIEMRKYLKNVLEETLGTDWFDQALDGASKEEIEKRISKMGKKEVGLGSLENPFDYALLENLRDVVLRRDNWNSYFSDYFEDKKSFEVKMEEIIDVRNQIAHFHPVYMNEAIMVTQNILWMFIHMRKRS